jgi:hypothetical protein
MLLIVDSIPLRVDEIATEWDIWKNTLKDIETLRIPRTYVPYLSKSLTKELHVFSDASEKAIAAVVYLQPTDTSGTKQLGFVLGKAKLFRGAELPDTFYSIAYIYEESPCLVTYVTKNYFTVSVKLYIVYF